MKAAGIIRQVDDLGKISEKKRLTVHIYGSTDNGEEHRTIVESFLQLPADVLFPFHPLR